MNSEEHRDGQSTSKIRTRLKRAIAELWTVFPECVHAYVPQKRHLEGVADSVATHDDRHTGVQDFVPLSGKESERRRALRDASERDLIQLRGGRNISDLGFDRESWRALKDLSIRVDSEGVAAPRAVLMMDNGSEGDVASRNSSTGFYGEGEAISEEDSDALFVGRQLGGVQEPLDWLPAANGHWCLPGKPFPLLAFHYCESFFACLVFCKRKVESALRRLILFAP